MSYIVIGRYIYIDIMCLLLHHFANGENPTVFFNNAKIRIM